MSLRRPADSRSRPAAPINPTSAYCPGVVLTLSAKSGGIIGAGFDEFGWPRPVRPGDELRVESEVLDVRASKSRPEQGLVKFRPTTLNQRDEAVQVSVGTLVVHRRPA